MSLPFEFNLLGQVTELPLYLLIRRNRSGPGAAAELLKTLVTALGGYTHLRPDSQALILMEAEDSHLVRDCLTLGLSHVGFGSAATDSVWSTLSDVHLVRSKLGEYTIVFSGAVLPPSGVRASFLLLKLDLQARGSIGFDSSDGWLQLARYREGSPAGWWMPRANYRFPENPKPSWDPESVTLAAPRARRRSAVCLVRGEVHLSLERLRQLVLLGFARDQDGRRPFSTVAGAGSVHLFALARGPEGLHAYKWHDEALDFVSQSEQLPDRFMTSIALDQADYSGAQAWLIPVLDLSRLKEKYGNRGRKLGMIELGITTQALIEAASKMECGYRLCGGADEYLLESLLKLGEWDELGAVLGLA